MNSKVITKFFFLFNCIFSLGCTDYSEYHFYVDVSNELAALETTYPSISQLSAIGQSHESRSIWALKISDTVDLDEDELPDYWEKAYFGNLTQGPNDDFDNDGFSNKFEFSKGTDPTDKWDSPIISHEPEDSPWLATIFTLIVIVSIFSLILGVKYKKKD